ncbi:MAG TPA: alkaline phosphatase family protein [Saprospiraceae bacterium]|nr:alkaline phosphatase family protein [Saprospiraceae bacterium]
MSNQKIKNVFILMLENHSFDNVFGLSGIPGINGLDGTETNTYDGKAYPVQKPAPDTMLSDPGHEFLDTLQQLCGKDSLTPIWKAGDSYPPQGSELTNEGFAANYATTTSEQTKIIHFSPPPESAIGDVMSCFDTPSQLPAMYILATQYAVCDNWFSSIPGPTWPNRFFAYAASSAGLDDSPTFKQQMTGELLKGFSFPNGTIFDLLEKHLKKEDDTKSTFRLYQDKYSKLSFPIVHALKGIHSSDMHDMSTFADDLAKDYDYPLTLIEPNYGDIFLDTYKGGSSQHPMDGMQKGEELIKTVYEAIFNSPLWENSLLIITYDEHGGFYDHVSPPEAHPPLDGTTKYSKHGFDFTRYGVRVPAVVVSPYIPANTVSKKLYDHTSMIKTVTENWNLPFLTDRDKHANGLSDLLTLDEPRKKSDCPNSLQIAITPDIKRPELTDDIIAKLDDLPLQESGNMIGFLQIACKLDFEMSDQSSEEQNRINDIINNFTSMGDARKYINSVQERFNQL